MTRVRRRLGARQRHRLSFATMLVRTQDDVAFCVPDAVVPHLGTLRDMEECVRPRAAGAAEVPLPEELKAGFRCSFSGSVPFTPPPASW